MTVIDTTVSLSVAQLAALRGAGVTGVSRYIAHSTGIGKIVSVAECQRYGPAGMQWILNWEQGAKGLGILSVAQTQTYAREAVAMAQARGYPNGCAIYVSADWDVTDGQWAAVAARLRAIRPIYSAAGYRLGLYAPYDALGWAKRDGLVDFYWQAGMSTAWSGRRNASVWPGAHLRQRRTATVAGVAGDINDVLIADYGQAQQEDDMQQTDKLIRPTGYDARVVGDVDADLENLRNWQYAKAADALAASEAASALEAAGKPLPTDGSLPGKLVNPPRVGSAAYVTLKAAVAASQTTTLPPAGDLTATLSDDEVQRIAAAFVAALHAAPITVTVQ